MPHIKEALFADPKLLRLPCLQYSDNFTCRVTKLYAKKPTNHTTPAPLLWWLWGELLDYLDPSGFAKGCKLEFTPFCATIDMPYTISLNFRYKKDNDNIELTAAYGGPYDEQRIFDAAIPRFDLPEKRKYVTLSIDQTTYEGESSSLDQALDYLMPRPGNTWRRAMTAFPTEKEETVVVALARTCKARDDRFFMSEPQDEQCKNLLKRFPAEAKEYISREKLVGKEGGSYSYSANRPDPLD
ncbi:hypothetical protein ColLi_13408 [Colletotrichum liriopes]|uniref:Uncharacterized protein n=1 Tax=Colletotrichum liriopes TaxID=708192 RepID=A0AA37H1H3_9PEZI|nr:hypothetical protein ColLi_12894 [Colletotrichum liriopes]GJC90570.1 hypothetical protein ColLi_13408 [Colletotrichum liriopes]